MFSQSFSVLPTFFLMTLACGLSLLPLPTLAQDIEDEGDLIVAYVEPDHADYTPIYESLNRTLWIDDVIESVNATYALPQDVQVVFAECGEENAFYDPNAVEITMCYELMAAYIEIYEEAIETEDDYDSEVYYSALYTLFHEIGHAFVDLYELPITGKEEDVVDEFAAIVLIETGEDGLTGTLAGIDQFQLDAEEASLLGQTPYWGEHSLDAQRYFTLSCLVYGSDPDTFADWVDDDDLPQERAESCPAEYEQKRESWSTLLEPYLK